MGAGVHLLIFIEGLRGAHGDTDSEEEYSTASGDVGKRAERELGCPSKVSILSLLPILFAKEFAPIKAVFPLFCNVLRRTPGIVRLGCSIACYRML